ncbi:MAG: lysophospholipid acyltransferase family protein [Acidobacteria bacterium]|nr:lysophospholipid acyltransferase family protein [Acidobacteriota bacterium]
MKVRHRLEALLVRIVCVLVRLLPMPAVRRLGHGIGRLGYLLEGARRRTALENLASAFPGRTARERRQLARAVFSHFGGLLFELIKFGTWSRERMLAAVEAEGEERVHQALAQGRGVLFFTGHFGYWEIHAMAHALRIEPISLLVRPLDNQQLDAMLEEIRTRTGNTLIPRRGAVRRILRDLAAGRGIAILIDQHLHEADAVHVGFFQRRAATTSAFAALALRTGAPVIPVFALPLPRGRYRLIYEHPVEPPLADTPDAVREFTQRCTDVLEMYVRRNPELWMWMHRRWRDPGSGIEEPGTGVRDPGTANQEPGTAGSRIPDPGSRERADV